MNNIYVLEAIDKDTGEIIYRREFVFREQLEMAIGDMEQAEAEYEENN